MTTSVHRQRHQKNRVWTISIHPSVTKEGKTNNSSTSIKNTNTTYTVCVIQEHQIFLCEHTDDKGQGQLKTIIEETRRKITKHFAESKILKVVCDTLTTGLTRLTKPPDDGPVVPLPREYTPKMTHLQRRNCVMTCRQETKTLLGHSTLPR